MYNPLEQFKVVYLCDFYNSLFDLSISNIAVILVIFWSSMIFLINISFDKWTYLFLQIINTFNREFTNLLTIRNTNYLPFILFIFIYTLFANLLGLIPYSFTLTSQLSVTFLWSATVMITVTYIGINKHKLGFVHLFIPKGVPKLLIPYIMLIEIISYLSRIFSLSIRLSVNMVAGHVLIYIISWFGFKMNIFVQSLIIVPVLILILVLEIGVSVIQAYVLAVLIATYIKDSILLH